MNRRVVGYSTLGSIAVAAVAGAAYLLWLSDTQADDQSGHLPAAASRSAAEQVHGSQGPDPLFSEPVQLWKQSDQPPVNDPFQDRSAVVVQGAYGDVEPQRLARDPNAKPLRGTDAQGYEHDPLPSARLTSASKDAASNAVEPEIRSIYGKSPDAGNQTNVSPRQAGGPQAASTAVEGANVDGSDSSSVLDRAYTAEGRPPAALFEAQIDEGGRRESPANDGFDRVEPMNDATGPLDATPTASSGGGYSPPENRSLGAQPPAAGNSALLDQPAAAASRAPRDAAVGAIGSGRPGSRQVEGKQAAQITIEKVGPEEIQVNKPAKFELYVRNSGAVVAQNVRVRDLIPEGTTFVAANPPANRGAQGELEWSLGALKPGDETTIEVEVMPMTEGEVGSVAVVTIQAEAGARSRVTKPDLTVQVTAAKEVMIGQEVRLSIKVANPGTGPATGVVLQEHVPPQLKHAAGAELEFEVGTLKPGETREMELVLSAAQAGRIVNRIAARGDGNLQAQAQCELEVIAPALAIQVEGPGRRYLERQATYTVSVSNPGTAPAKDVELVTRLPRGLKFVKANNSGHYDPNTHTVTWSLEELPPADTGTVMLTAIPIEPGEQRLRAEARAKQNITDEEEQLTVVEGLAALLFEVMDVDDPIEVEGETEYEIRITNQGSKAAENVRLAALIPPELKFVSAEGPTRYTVNGQRVIFEPIARLAPKADTSYRVAVQGLQPGDLRMKVQLITDDMRQPVTKEESTRVYSDE